MPADRGSAAGNTAAPGSERGKVNLDGSISGGGAPTAAPGASAPLNLDLHGAGIGPSNNRSRNGLLPILPAPPEPKTKLQSDLEKAQKAECEKAYAQHGLLAVVPLAADALSGKGCKW